MQGAKLKRCVCLRLIPTSVHYVSIAGASDRWPNLVRAFATRGIAKSVRVSHLDCSLRGFPHIQTWTRAHIINCTSLRIWLLMCWWPSAWVSPYWFFVGNPMATAWQQATRSKSERSFDLVLFLTMRKVAGMRVWILPHHGCAFSSAVYHEIDDALFSPLGPPK